MTTSDLWRAAEDLAAARRPFVLATVVRRQRPSSVRPGDAAIVHPDGRIEGFVGGACATSTVRLHALRALETEEPMLVRIRPGAGDEPAEGGVVTVANPCLSGGEMEIFLEPRLPAPVIRVLGDSPIAHALAQLGAPLGFDVVPGGEPERGDAAVVVAAHGDGDEGRVETALLAGVPYVGLVASPKRAAAMRAELEASGLCGSQLDRLKSPAGLDIGSRTHAEVALSILAEIVARRARTAAAPAPAPPPVDAVVDPVCGMVEPPGAGWPRVEHAGQTYAFCCAGCQQRFERDPERYLAGV
jgi:xanthine dehydrogenase accessory factor